MKIFPRVANFVTPLMTTIHGLMNVSDAISLCVLLSSAILRRYLSAQQFVWVSFSEQGLRVGGGGEGVGGVYKTPIRGRQKESISATHLGDFPRILSFAWHKILPVFLYHGLCCQIK